MKGTIGVALGVVGTVLAIIALVKVGDSGFDEQTLQLAAGNETRVEFDASATVKGHPLASTAWSSNSEISGDRTGEYVRTCIPVPIDEIECSGSFLLEDGDIEVDLTEEAEPSDAKSDGAVIGGTGAYDGATGSVDVDWQKETYTLNLKIPR
jgi:hypothetical protein